MDLTLLILTLFLTLLGKRVSLSIKVFEFEFSLCLCLCLSFSLPLSPQSVKMFFCMFCFVIVFRSILWICLGKGFIEGN